VEKATEDGYHTILCLRVLLGCSPINRACVARGVA
jgi:hypothetical protein